MPRTLVSSRPIRVPIEPLSQETFEQFGQVVQNPHTHHGRPDLHVVEANQGSARKVLDVTAMRNWYELAASKKAASVSMNMFVCKPRALAEREGRQVFPVKILERHPFTPQTFIPMGLGKEDRNTCYLVIVAPTLPLGSRMDRASISKAYPVPVPKRKPNLRERLLGARPNPFTNDHSSSTTPTSSNLPSDRRPKGPGLPDLDNIKAFIARGDQAVTYGAGTWHAPMVVLGEQPIEFVVVQYANGVGIEDCQEVEIETEDDEDGLAVDVTGVIEEQRPARAKL